MRHSEVRQPKKIRRTSLLTLGFALACLMTHLPALAEPAAAEAVNLDDPNLAFTSEFATDSAVTCSKKLKGPALEKCQKRNGSAAPDLAQISLIEDGAVLTSPPSKKPSR